jgi:hypothetical protein
MAGIERYAARRVVVPVRLDRPVVPMQQSAVELARRGFEVEVSTVRVRPAATAPRTAIVRPVPTTAYHRPAPRRGRAVAVLTGTVAALSSLAGLGYWFATSAAGVALLKAIGLGVAGLVAVLVIAALVSRRCPGVRVHCGGCEK